MKTQQLTRTVRRSVALPSSLVEEVSAAAPPELKGNLNRLVTLALREFVDRRRSRQFRRAMAAMASDPAIQAENSTIAREFATTESDGLSHD